MLQTTVLLWIIPFFLAHYAESNPRSLELLHAELVRVGEDLLQQTETRAEFWFFKQSVVVPCVEKVFEQILAMEPFASRPKSVINENADWWTGSVSGLPTVAFVFLGFIHHDTQRIAISAQLLRIPVHSKLVVVFTFISVNHLSTVLKLFVEVRLLDVLYIAVYPDRNQYEIFIYFVHGDVVQVLRQYESLKQVFPGQTDLEGQTVNACTHYGGSFSEVDTASGSPKGVDVELVRVIVGHMNGTLNIKFIECRPDERFVRCVERRLDLSQCLFNFGRWRLENVDYGVPLMPFHSQVLVVARGEPFSVYELVAAPFTKSLWNLLKLVFFVGLCTAIFLKICPQLNLLGLSRDDTIRKLLVLGINLLTWVVLCGYEAKIVSFLANWPSKHDVNRVEDLQAAGIHVILDTFILPNNVSKDARLMIGTLHVNRPLSSYNFSSVAPNTGLLVEYGAAMRLKKYDKSTGRTRFKIVDERLNTTLLFYHFGFRNGLIKHFGTILTYLYEVGIDQHWMGTEDLPPGLFYERNTSTSMITYVELKQMIPVLMELWMLCVVVFVIEFICYKWAQLLNKVRARKMRPLLRERAQTYPLLCEKRRLKTTRKSF